MVKNCVMQTQMMMFYWTQVILKRTEALIFSSDDIATLQAQPKWETGQHCSEDPIWVDNLVIMCN